MNNMKKLIFTLLFAAVLILGGCSNITDRQTKDAVSSESTSYSSDSDKEYNFIFVCPVAGHEYWVSCAEGIKEADRRLNTHTVITGPESPDNYETEMLKYVEDAISQKPDGIIMYSGISGLYPLIDKAVAQGIPVISIDSDAPSTGRSAYVGSNELTIGKTIAADLLDRLDGTGKIAFIVSTRNSEKEMAVVEPFKDAMSDYNIEIVDIAEGNITPESAEKAVSELLEKHPDIDAICATSSNNVTGAGRVKKALGLDDLILIGFDDTEENIALTREGIINTLLVQPIRSTGLQSVYLMKQLVTNGSLSAENYDSGITVVNRDNIDTYKDDPSFQTSNNRKIVRIGYYPGYNRFHSGFSDKERKSGYGYEYYQTISSYVNWDYRYFYVSRAEAMEMLKKGDLDIVCGVNKTDYLMDSMLFSDSDIGLDIMDLYFAVNKSRPDLLIDLNYAMDTISKEMPAFLPDLKKKYYTEISHQIITENESLWLNEKKNLKIGYVNNNLPISGTDESGNICGLVKDLMDILKKYNSVDIEPICYDNIRTLEADLVAGRVDAAFPFYSDMWVSESKGYKETNMVMSDRIMVIYTGDFSKKSFETLAMNHEELEQFHYVENYYPNTKIVYYNTRAEAMDAVIRGEADGVIGCATVYERFVKEHPKYQNMNTAYLELSENLCFAVRNDNGVLLSILNKSLDNVDRARVTNSIAMYSAVDPTFRTVIRNNAALFLVLMLFVVIIILVMFALYASTARAFNKIQSENLHKLEQAVNEANEANQAKTRFLSSISHDIRTPMNAIIGMTDIAKFNLGNLEKVGECLGKIDIAGQHMITLINNVLDIAKIESGQLAFTPSDFRMINCFKSLVTVTEAQVKTKALTFTTDISGLDQNLTVYADEVRIDQIFINILSNAIKYTQSGGRVGVTLSSSLSDDGKTALITYIVEDNGMGMSKEYMAIMYESFTRAKDTRINKTQGTGLGLAIVKQLVDMMNGTINCESEENVGTKFTITLSLPVGSDHDDTLDYDNPLDGAAFLNGKSILVAEDYDFNWEVISELMTMLGAGTKRAVNGEECVMILKDAAPGTFDFILMDVQMPVMNGREATKLIREDERDYINSIPIIAMTADSFAEDIEENYKAKMDGHISKPLDMNKFIQEVKRVLEARRP